MSPKIVLVTGANRSIGFCIAQLLGQHRDVGHVLVTARSQTSGEESMQKLQALVPDATFRLIVLDVTKDQSIRDAVQAVQKEFGSLDVIINNAGIASNPKEDLADYRTVYNDIFNTNITSVGLVTALFLPLLGKSHDPRVINISSGRASITNLTLGKVPPTASIPYSVSKAAENFLTVEMARMYPDVTFQLANPGHCKTAFNGFRGLRDPLEGAEVVVDLAMAPKGQYEAGFWEKVDGAVRAMPW